MERIKELLYSKFLNNDFNEKTLDDALEMIEVNTDKKKIKFAYESLFLYSGVAFILSSILYFVAFNWKGMGSITKLGLMVFLLLIPYGIYMSKLKENYRNLALLSFSFLVGVLFALFGQIYQTGADSYTLFITWALAITPIVFICRYTPTYILYFLILFTGISLYLISHSGKIGHTMFICLFPILTYLLLLKFKKKIGANKWIFKTVFIFNYFIYMFYVPKLSIDNSHNFLNFYLAIGVYIVSVLYIHLVDDIDFNSYFNKIVSLIPMFVLIGPLVVVSFIVLFKNSYGDGISLVLLALLIIMALYILLIREVRRLSKEVKNAKN